MITTEYSHKVNKIELEPSNNKVRIGNGYYGTKVDGEENHYPLVYQKNHHTKKGKKYVYKVNLFGQTNADARPFYIALNFWENLKFLWIQKKTWIHSKENIMWFINIMVAVLAIVTFFKTV